MKILLTFLILLTICLGGSFKDTYEKGIKFYEKQNYKEAFRTWKPLADNGNKFVQHNIAHMYEKGLGVKTNYLKAKEYYLLAAKQNFHRSQFSLGNFYQSFAKNTVL